MSKTIITEIYIYELDRMAEAQLSNGYLVPCDYLEAERILKKKIENNKYPNIQITKFNKRV